MDINFIKCAAQDMSDYFTDLAYLRMTVFKEFPYLYEGSLEEEKDYLSVYEKSPKSLVVLARYQEKIIGATTCIPLSDETKEFYQCFIEKGIDIERTFYFGESVILKEYRGHKIGHAFFKLREQHAKKHIPNLEYTAFCAVDRPSDHPLRPKNYRALKAFWQRMGYEQQDNMKVHYPWKDVDKPKEDTKAMTVWLKEHQ